jgi:hypothetical protein
MNNTVSISGLVRPSLAIRATFSSWAVGSKRLYGTLAHDVASSQQFTEGPLGEDLGSYLDEQLVGRP